MQSELRLKLTIVTGALGAGFAGSAQATIVSKAPVGFMPVVITANDGVGSSASFDVDGDSLNDFTINGDANTKAIGISALQATSTVSVDTTFMNEGNVLAYADPSAFPPAAPTGVNTGQISFPIKIGPGYFYASNFGSTTMYGDVTLGNGAVQGYFAGTYGDDFPTGSTADFTLTDYGIITASTVVPEPASLALLASGAAGVGLLRRRRSARAA